MIPINSNKNLGCTLISSACVLWQGNNIECIEICKGDSVQDVINKLAESYCNLYKSLDPTSFDLSCYDFGNCLPPTFHDLFQHILNVVCLLTNATGIDSDNVPIDGFYVPLPECLRFVDDYGKIVTQLPLYHSSHNDYQTLIGAKICELFELNVSTKSSIANISDQLQIIQRTLAVNQISLPTLNHDNNRLFTCLSIPSGSSVPFVWKYYIELMMDYFRRLNEVYDGFNNAGNNNCNGFFSTNSFNNLYNRFSNNRRILCSSGDLSLSLNPPYNIIKTFNNIFTYIVDIRETIEAMLCNTCNVCSAVSNIRIGHYFTDEDTLNITLNPLNGWAYSNVTYSLYIAQGNLISNGTIPSSGSHTINNTNFPSYPFFYLHIKGCILDISIQNSKIRCSFDNIVYIPNPHYGCKRIFVTNVDVSRIEIVQ